MKYSFRGVEGRRNSSAFTNYIQNRLDHWKMDIWQLGTNDISSEWNSLRPSLDCACRGRVVDSERHLEFEFGYWYFVHALRCLNDNLQKIEEFAVPLLDYLEKEGQAFWTEKEATWARIAQKAQEVNYKIQEDDFPIRKSSIMNCRNEADLIEEEESQINYLNEFQKQNHKPAPQQIQQEEQKAQKRETQRQQKQAEQKQKDEILTQRIVEEVQKNNSPT
ncbi:MAG: hypothetical protein LBR43_02950, partial [Spiroplasmataceae bacterium]|nr:hypothetical protein [Spiroplasmataceae bacterium]